MISVRAGTEADAPTAAALHASEISEGFLPSLGRPFLARLYRRVVLAPQSFLFVAEDEATIVGFIAGAEDVGLLYRSFLLHDGAGAAIRALPRIVRSWRRVFETLRYGTSSDDALPPAELLAVAVAPSARGRGVGHSLVDALTAEFARRRSDGVRVVVGADNASAIALYERSGFKPAVRIEVHRGTPSQVLTWP